TVRLTQMKWKGIVSSRGQSVIAAAFRNANAPHERSSSLGRDAIADMADGLDGVDAELLPEPAHADLDDVGAGVEVVAPDVGRARSRAASSAGRSGPTGSAPAVRARTSAALGARRSRRASAAAGRGRRGRTGAPGSGAGPRLRRRPNRRHSLEPRAPGAGTRGSEARPRSTGSASPARRNLSCVTAR